MRYLKDTLHFDFIGMYSGPSHIIDTLLFATPPDSADTAWIANEPNPRTQWCDRQIIRRWSELDAVGLKVVYAFDAVVGLPSSAIAVEASVHAERADEPSLQL